MYPLSIEERSLRVLSNYLSQKLRGLKLNEI